MKEECKHIFVYEKFKFGEKDGLGYCVSCKSEIFLTYKDYSLVVGAVYNNRPLYRLKQVE